MIVRAVYPLFSVCTNILLFYCQNLLSSSKYFRITPKHDMKLRQNSKNDIEAVCLFLYNCVKPTGNKLILGV